MRIDSGWRFLMRAGCRASFIGGLGLLAIPRTSAAQDIALPVAVHVPLPRELKMAVDPQVQPGKYSVGRIVPSISLTEGAGASLMNRHPLLGRELECDPLRA